MSINDATPQEWNKSTSKLTDTGAYIDPYDLPPADLVSAPPHYNNGDIECIDAIKASMSVEAFKGYCKGNCQKYIWRMSYKGKPVEDLRKARWYLDRLIDAEVENPTEIAK